MHIISSEEVFWKILISTRTLLRDEPRIQEMGDDDRLGGGAHSSTLKPAALDLEMGTMVDDYNQWFCRSSDWGCKKRCCSRKDCR